MAPPDARRWVVDPSRPGRRAVAAAAAALRRGEAILLPTDTVYGIAVRPGHETRLYAAKGRDPAKPIPLLAADAADAQAAGAMFSPAAAALARRFWPGPLTLVLPAGTATEGFRVPDHAVARAVLAASGGVLRVTSANRSGEPEALDAGAALASLGAHVALALDAGPAPGGVPSTVAAVDAAGTVRVLREGAIPAAWITAPLRVLFVCTGNSCRSPMAEGLLRAWLGRPSPWEVASAGLAAEEGWPISEETVAAMREKGIDLAGQRTRALTADRVDAARRIVVMTRGHRDALLARFPEAEGRLILLREFAPGRPGDDVDDPVGQSIDAYRYARDRMEAAMPDLVLHLRETAGDAQQFPWRGRT